jgi:hypothetical protein
MFGLALDLGCGEENVDELAEIIDREVPDLRVGKYKNFIHIDVGYYIYPRATRAWRKGARW